MRPKKKADAHKIIKAMRLYLGMTQKEAAKKCGISLCVYQKYENIPGELLKGRFSDVYRMLRMLNLEPENLLVGNYQLNDLGHKVTSRRTGPLNTILRKALQNCCPVVSK